MSVLHATAKDVSADAHFPSRAAARTPKLDIRSVTKRYGSVVAVDDVSLEIADGEFLTLLGPSGSGKTTLLSIIAGLAVPDEGEVRIESKLATYTPTHKRDIGMVFQNYALFPHLSVFENIAFPLRMRRMPEARIRQEVERVLDIVELPQVAGRLPRQLSGGQQQRIALARCMVYSPSITIMDEPLGALDKGLRDAMQLEIKRLHQRLGITILYVTHDQEEALALSDRICLMRDGRAEQISMPNELYFTPRSVFAARFIGDSNLIAGTVTGRSGDETSVSHAGGTIVARQHPGSRRFDVGDRVVAMVRPESIQLSDAAATENSVSGALESVLFVGSVVNAFLRTPCGASFQSKMLTSREIVKNVGTREATMGWSRDDVILLEPDPTIDV